MGARALPLCAALVLGAHASGGRIATLHVGDADECLVVRDDGGIAMGVCGRAGTEQWRLLPAHGDTAMRRVALEATGKHRGLCAEPLADANHRLYLRPCDPLHSARWVRTSSPALQAQAQPAQRVVAALSSRQPPALDGPMHEALWWQPEADRARCLGRPGNDGSSRVVKCTQPSKCCYPAVVRQKAPHLQKLREATGIGVASTRQPGEPRGSRRRGEPGGASRSPLALLRRIGAAFWRRTLALYRAAASLFAPSTRARLSRAARAVGSPQAAERMRAAAAATAARAKSGMLELRSGAPAGPPAALATAAADAGTGAALAPARARHPPSWLRHLLPPRRGDGRPRGGGRGAAAGVLDLPAADAASERRRRSRFQRRFVGLVSTLACVVCLISAVVPPRMLERWLRGARAAARRCMGYPSDGAAARRGSPAKGSRRGAADSPLVAARCGADGGAAAPGLGSKAGGRAIDEGNGAVAAAVSAYCAEHDSTAPGAAVTPGEKPGVVAAAPPPVDDAAPAAATPRAPALAASEAALGAVAVAGSAASAAVGSAVQAVAGGAAPAVPAPTRAGADGALSGAAADTAATASAGARAAPPAAASAAVHAPTPAAAPPAVAQRGTAVAQPAAAAAPESREASRERAANLLQGRALRMLARVALSRAEVESRRAEIESRASREQVELISANFAAAEHRAREADARAAAHASELASTRAELAAAAAELEQARAQASANSAAAAAAAAARETALARSEGLAAEARKMRVYSRHVRDACRAAEGLSLVRSGAPFLEVLLADGGHGAGGAGGGAAAGTAAAAAAAPLAGPPASAGGGGGSGGSSGQQSRRGSSASGLFSLLADGAGAGKRSRARGGPQASQTAARWLVVRGGRLHVCSGTSRADLFPERAVQLADITRIAYGLEAPWPIEEQQAMVHPPALRFAVLAHRWPTPLRFVGGDQAELTQFVLALQSLMAGHLNQPYLTYSRMLWGRARAAADETAEAWGCSRGEAIHTAARTALRDARPTGLASYGSVGSSCCSCSFSGSAATTAESSALRGGGGAVEMWLLGGSHGASQAGAEHAQPAAAGAAEGRQPVARSEHEPAANGTSGGARAPQLSAPTSPARPGPGAGQLGLASPSSLSNGTPEAARAYLGVGSAAHAADDDDDAIDGVRSNGARAGPAHESAPPPPPRMAPPAR